MRTRFSEQISSLNQSLSAMADLATRAVEHATVAVVHADLDRAEQVITAQASLTSLGLGVEQQVFTILARQAPVAADLRAVITALHVAVDLERMGALAVHIAEVARRHHPGPAVPQQSGHYFLDMGRTAQAMAATTSEILLTHDPDRAAQLARDDDTINDLHRHLFTALTEQQWPHGITGAINTTLLSRYYERFADHTVLIGQRIIFHATGTRPPTPTAQ